MIYMSKLNGKAALVTGASRGIGGAIAKRLAQEGALTAVHYGKNREAAEEVVREIERSGGRAFAIGAVLDTVRASNRSTLPWMKNYGSGQERRGSTYWSTTPGSAWP